MQITLTITENKSKHDIAVKLHRQFAHTPAEKLVKLLNAAGEPWCGDSELKNEIQKVTNNCQTCKDYRKATPRPVVGLPMASTFQECVAMDLKFYKRHILLHLVDHAT